MKKALGKGVQAARGGLLTTNSWKRRLTTTVTGVIAYMYGMNLTAWEDMGSPHAIIGLIGVVLAGAITTPEAGK